MTWHAVYRESDGTLLSVTTVVPGTLPTGVVSTAVGETQPTGPWNASTRQFDVAPAAPRLISARDFVQRLTPREYVAIVDDADATTRYFVEQVKIGEPVNLASASLSAALDHLIARGHIAGARKAQLTA